MLFLQKDTGNSIDGANKQRRTLLKMVTKILETLEDTAKMYWIYNQEGEL